jgi:hypothetical protein
MSSTPRVLRAFLAFAFSLAAACDSAEPSTVQKVVVASPSGDLRIAVSAGAYELALIEQGESDDSLNRSTRTVQAGTASRSSSPQEMASSQL